MSASFQGEGRGSAAVFPSRSNEGLDPGAGGTGKEGDYLIESAMENHGVDMSFHELAALQLVSVVAVCQGVGVPGSEKVHNSRRKVQVQLPGAATMFHGFPDVSRPCTPSSATEVTILKHSYHDRSFLQQ